MSPAWVSTNNTIWGSLELEMLQHRLDWANTQAVSAAKVIPKRKTDLKHRNWEKADLLFKIWDYEISLINSSITLSYYSLTQRLTVKSPDIGIDYWSALSRWLQILWLVSYLLLKAPNIYSLTFIRPSDLTWYCLEVIWLLFCFLLL